MSEDATWKDVFLTALIALPLLGGLGYVMWNGDKLPTEKEVVLSSCKDLVSKYSDADLSKIEPLIISGDSAGGISPVRGAIILKVVWKQNEWNIDVQCEGYRKLETGKFVFVSLFSNGKDLTGLVRREERK